MPLRLVVVFTLFIGLQAVCPRYSCISMPNNQCGNRLTTDQIQITTEACADAKECTLQGFLTWVAGTSQTYLCTDVIVSHGEEPEWTYGACLTYREQQTWKSGGTVVTCHQDSDCVKADSSYRIGSCVCVPRSDGNGICNPDSSNTDVFGDYWTLCKEENARIEDQDTYDYWNFAFNYWVYLQTDISCISTFTELETYTELLDDYDSASVLLGLLVTQLL